MEINETQKFIYNKYLKVLAKKSNRGYKARQNFDKLDKNTEVILKRLETFFNKHNDLDIEQFFLAGFNFLHENFVPLDFFVSYKAIVAFKKTR